MSKSTSIALNSAASLTFLLLSALPAGAQQDPPFVARGPAKDATFTGPSVSCNHDGAVAMWPNGRSVMGWLRGTLGAGYLLYDAEGDQETNQIGNIGTGDRVDVSASVASGGFVATFSRRSSTVADGLYIRIVDPGPPSNTPPPFRFEESRGQRSVVAAGADGTFVLAWELGLPSAVMAGRFDRAGNQLGSDILVAELPNGVQSLDLTRAADGSFVVYWITLAEGLHYRRYGADGSPLDDTQIAAATSPAYVRTAVAPDGTAAMVYLSGATRLAARTLGPDGELGEEFEVWDQPANPAGGATLEFLSDGSLAVAAEIHFSGGAGSIHLLRFGRDGEPTGPRVAVSIPTMPERTLHTPRIAAAEHRVVVYYQVQDGPSSPGCLIYSRPFDATLFADGFESGSLAAWTGAL